MNSLSPKSNPEMELMTHMTVMAGLPILTSGPSGAGMLAIMVQLQVLLLKDQGD